MASGACSLITEASSAGLSVRQRPKDKDMFLWHTLDTHYCNSCDCCITQLQQVGGCVGAPGIEAASFVALFEGSVTYVESDVSRVALSLTGTDLAASPCTLLVTSNESLSE